MSLSSKLIPSLLASAVCASLALVADVSVASGGPSGPAFAFRSTGNIGEVIVNPYKVSPLTAVIRNGGYEIHNAVVRIVPKKGGQEIKYEVGDRQILNHGGIPVFGLYADYLNTVEVEYDRVFNGKTEHFKDRYQFYTAPVFFFSNGTNSQSSTSFDVKVTKTDPAFKDRLYFINNLVRNPPDGARMVWNNPSGGALEWQYNPENAIIDSTGEVRWYLLPNQDMFDQEQPYKAGIMMGFQQTAEARSPGVTDSATSSTTCSAANSSAVVCRSAMPTIRTPSTRRRTGTRSCAFLRPTCVVPTTSASIRCATSSSRWMLKETSSTNSSSGKSSILIATT